MATLQPRLRLVRKVSVLYNARSGAGRSGPQRPLAEQLTELLTRRGVESVVREFEPATVREDVCALVAGRPDAVLVAGGDGTVRSVVEHLAPTGIPLGVLPTGTMNLLARDLGVPEDVETAVDALLAARVEMIDVARVNGRIFLCSSALAMMPHLGRIRERARAERGWPWLRLWARAVRIWRRYPQMHLRLVVDGTVHEVRTRAIVIANNPFAPRAAPVPTRTRLDTGELVVYVTHDRSHWDLVSIAAKLLDGSWLADRRLRTYNCHTMQVLSSRLEIMSVMSDGEVAQLEMPLVFEIVPGALAVLAPNANS
jgi:diacylglycerol kinase family enzyme